MIRELVSRQRDPIAHKMSELDRGDDKDLPPGVYATIGKKDGEWHVVDYVFDANDWDRQKATDWLNSNDHASLQLRERERDEGGTYRLDNGAQRLDSVVTPRVSRSDYSRLAKPSLTKEGFLRCEGVITRAGVFEYETADGETVREFRPPEEVFAKESLESFELVPVTLDHPLRNLTPETVEIYQ